MLPLLVLSGAEIRRPPPAAKRKAPEPASLAPEPAAPTDADGERSGSPRAAVCISVGSRATQEDAYTIVHDCWAVESGGDGDGAGGDAVPAREPGSERWPAARFYGVFDGHSGAAASSLASSRLWRELRRMHGG